MKLFEQKLEKINKDWFNSYKSRLKVYLHKNRL